MKCLPSARYTMTATLLTMARPDVVDGTNGSIVVEQDRDGRPVEIEYVQDPISGALERKWRYASADGTLSSVDANLPENRVDFPCSAKGFIDGGLRLVGTDERYSSRGYVETVDAVNFKFPSYIVLSDRDRITMIRQKRGGKVLWKEENGSPTIFEVSGVTPVTDVFGNHFENSCLLRRAEVQGGSVG